MPSTLVDTEKCEHTDKIPLLRQKKDNKYK